LEPHLWLFKTSLGWTKFVYISVPKELLDNHTNVWNCLHSCLSSVVFFRKRFAFPWVQWQLRGPRHMIVHHSWNGYEWHGTVWFTTNKKFEFTPAADKVIVMNFWDHQGALHIKFIQNWTTINAASYCEILKRLRTYQKDKYWVASCKHRVLAW
jgi:hypothetical protein